jgi:hypothetical protein
LFLLPSCWLCCLSCLVSGFLCSLTVFGAVRIVRCLQVLHGNHGKRNDLHWSWVYAQLTAYVRAVGDEQQHGPVPAALS